MDYISDICDNGTVDRKNHIPETNGLNKFWCRLCGVELYGGYVDVGTKTIKELSDAQPHNTTPINLL